jgi:hypothetical protein
MDTSIGKPPFHNRKNGINPVQHGEKMENPARDE